MAVRKSKLIGQSINGFLIKDSVHIGTQTKLNVICEECGKAQMKSWHSIKDQKCECEYCGNGRKRRNAGGHYGTPLYNKYMQIIRRTENPSKDNFRYYGGRGIKVCKEWQEDFCAFYEWAMANGYREDLTIDRIDVNGDYSPSNCRWVTAKEQANNRRSNIFKTYNGETKTLAQWADEYGLPRYIVYNRNRAGWDIRRILTEPIDTSKRSVNFGNRQQEYSRFNPLCEECKKAR